MSKCYIDENGYYRFKDSNIPVHRWVAERKLKRKLNPGEVVHHIDRDKLNNHPSNLWIFANQDDHDRAHEIDADRFGHAFSYGYGFEDDYDDDDDDDDDDNEDEDFY